MSLSQQFANAGWNLGSAHDRPAHFTAAQRSQQARGKSYASPTAGEPYEARQKREQAAQILENLELLIWHANARNEVCALLVLMLQDLPRGLAAHGPWVVFS